MEKVYSVHVRYLGDIEAIGLFRSKKNAYKQAYSYEFNGNKRIFEGNLGLYEELYERFDDEFDKDNKKFIDTWITAREKALSTIRLKGEQGVLAFGVHAGYRHIVTEVKIMD